MDMPASTINQVEQATFDERKAYVPQEGKGQAFVRRSDATPIMEVLMPTGSLTMGVRSSFSISYMATLR